MERGTLAQALLALLTASGCSKPPGAVQCPEGARMLDGLCRFTCAGAQDCLLSERCEASICTPTDPANGPFFARFELSRTTLAAPDTIELDYAVFHADTVELVFGPSGQGVSDVQALEPHVGERSLFVQVSTVYSLVAYAGGQRFLGPSVQVQLRGEPSPLTVQLTASKRNIRPGETTELSWIVQGAERVQLEQEGEVLDPSVAPVDTLSVMPELTTRYSIAAFAGGREERQTVFISVMDSFPEPSLGVGQPDAELYEGMTALIGWNTELANLIKVHDPQGRLLFTTARQELVESGFLIVRPPPGMSSYIIEAEGPGGAKSASIEVQTTPLRQPPRFTSFSGTPNTLNPNFSTSVELQWGLSAPAGPPDVHVFRNEEGPFLPMGQSFHDAIEPGERARYKVIAENMLGLEPHKGGGADLQEHTVMEIIEEPPELAGGQPGMLVELDRQAVQGRLGLQDFLGDDYGVWVDEGGSLEVHLQETACLDGLELGLMASNGDPIDYDVGAAGLCPLVSTRSLGPRAPGDFYTIHLTLGGISLMEAFDYLLVPVVTPPSCGDGNLSQGVEACDDGNRQQGDGCDALCQLEPSFQYSARQGSNRQPPSGLEEAIFLPYSSDGLNVIDAGYAQLILPFDFFFFGRPYRGVLVHRDGFISFLPDHRAAGFDPVSAQGPAAPNAVIAVFRADLRGGAVYSVEDGDRFHIHFEGMNLVGSPGSSLSATVTLHASGQIDVSYTDLNTGATDGIVQAGLEGPQGRYGVAPDPCVGVTPDAGPLGQCALGSLQELRAVEYRIQ